VVDKEGKTEKFQSDTPKFKGKNQEREVGLDNIKQNALQSLRKRM